MVTNVKTWKCRPLKIRNMGSLWIQFYPILLVLHPFGFFWILFETLKEKTKKKQKPRDARPPQGEVLHISCGEPFQASKWPFVGGWLFGRFLRKASKKQAESCSSRILGSKLLEPWFFWGLEGIYLPLLHLWWFWLLMFVKSNSNANRDSKAMWIWFWTLLWLKRIFVGSWWSKIFSVEQHANDSARSTGTCPCCQRHFKKETPRICQKSKKGCRLIWDSCRFQKKEPPNACLFDSNGARVWVWKRSAPEVTDTGTQVVGDYVLHEKLGQGQSSGPLKIFSEKGWPSKAWITRFFKTWSFCVNRHADDFWLV